MCKLNNEFWINAFIPFVPNPPKWKLRGNILTNKLPTDVVLSDLFGLEHNRLCDEFHIAYPDWSQDQLFEEARKWYRIPPNARSLFGGGERLGCGLTRH